MEAREFRVEDALRGGARVTFRAVRAGDEERVAKAFAGLAPSTVYTRFFGYKSALSARELAHIGEIDFVDEVMLVATVPGEGGEEVVGSARYVTMGGEARTAEVSFTVEEDYQGQGIASRLLGHLAAIARANGFATLEAFVLADNRPMLAVFARSGLSVRQRREDDAIHVILSLGPAAPPTVGP